MRFVVLLTFILLMAPAALAQSQSARDAALRGSIAKELATATNTLRKVNTSIQQAQDKMAELEAELDALRKQENTLKDQLSENVQKHHFAMANLVRLERQPLRAMLTYDAFKVQPQRQPILAISRKALNKRIEENREKLAELLQVTHQKEIHQGQLTATRQKLEAHRGELASLQQKQRELLSLPPRERRRLQSEATEVARLGDIEKLLNVSSALTGIKPPAQPEATTARNRLPIKGVILSRYGQANPETGIPATGVRIKGVSGQTVKAVRDGRILYAGPFKGFGFLVIMEHDEDVHSLYGGMGTPQHKVGEFVTAGKAIGTLPEKPDPSLYLEVRQAGKPINPQRWLGL